MMINYSLYPANWRTEIRPAILARANNCCEECGVMNYATGARDLEGNWHDSKEICNMNSDVGYGYFGKYGVKDIRIVLTVAHICNNSMCSNPAHLLALCQRCHNKMDMPFRKMNAKITNIKKKKQILIFDNLATQPSCGTNGTNLSDCLIG